MQTKYPVGTRVRRVSGHGVLVGDANVVAVPAQHEEEAWANATNIVWLANAGCLKPVWSNVSAWEPVPIVEAPETDDVRTPTHYQVFPGTESIEIIARSMTQAEFRGFCMGNVLKYRLRAGKKSDQASIEKDLGKADFYKELFEEHKYKCHSLK
ncbi:MAG: hypothetical protein [Bacteriophage sp.]|nr:MAG: hypothetical protein [Bacteriophage sp.]